MCIRDRTQDNMEVCSDEKVTNEKETRALGIEVGDFVSFDPRTIVTDTCLLYTYRCV